MLCFCDVLFLLTVFSKFYVVMIPGKHDGDNRRSRNGLYGKSVLVLLQDVCNKEKA